MKQTVTILVLAFTLSSLLVSACGAAPAAQPTAVQITATKPPLTKVLFATDSTYPPFESVDAGYREMIGFDIDLMKAIADKANLEVEYTTTGYPAVLVSVADCTVDGAISAISVTDELKQKMSFSEPYYSLGQVIVVQQANIVITGVDKLSGMTVGVQAGTPGATAAQKINGAQVKSYESYQSLFQDLMYGMIDAVVIDQALAVSYTKMGANQLKIVGGEVAKDEYAIAVCKTKTDLLQKINDALKSVKSEGLIQKLTEKWITNPVQ